MILHQGQKNPQPNHRLSCPGTETVRPGFMQVAACVPKNTGTHQWLVQADSTTQECPSLLDSGLSPLGSLVSTDVRALQCCPFVIGPGSLCGALYVNGPVGSRRDKEAAAESASQVSKYLEPVRGSSSIFSGARSQLRQERDLKVL